MVGFSEIIITPKIGSPMGGYSARIGNSSGIHDDLFARAIYLRYDDKESLIVSADILSIPLEIVKFYRKLIYQEIGIQESQIFICALHNHSGPDTMGIINPLRGFFRPGLDLTYFQKLGLKFVTLAQKAKNNSQDANIGAAKEPIQKRLIINRRAPLKNSKFDIGVIRFDDLNGNILGIIINYACHGTVLPSNNTLLTAEYPGYIIQRAKELFGEHTNILYLNGPCADLNPNLFSFEVDLNELDQKKALLYDGPGHARGTFTRAREIGYFIAEISLEISRKIKCLPVTEFKHINHSITIPMRHFIYDNSLKTQWKNFLFRMKLFILKLFWRSRKLTIPYPMDYILKDGKFYQLAEIHLLKINNIGLVGVPGELFLELGQKIIEKSLIQNTFVFTLSNGYLGYLYPIEDFRIGGYELFLSTNPLTGTILTTKAIKLLNSL